MTTTCHAIGCEASIDPTFLMCPPHWRMVPLPVQRLVWQSLDQSAGAWQIAAARAIAVVAVREKRMLPAEAQQHVERAVAISRPTPKETSWEGTRALAEDVPVPEDVPEDSPDLTPADVLSPFCKWVGTKRWVASALADRVRERLAPNGRYFEAFLGSGAVALALPAGTEMVLGDACAPLMGVWWWIKHKPQAINEALSTFIEDWSVTEANYYRIRDAFNAEQFSSRSPLPAARFLWLNRTGYNGIYRENQGGGYNVPWGKKTKITLPTADHLDRVSRHLKTASVMLGGGFEATLRTVRAGDVLFIDPPYDEVYDGYNAGGFGAKGQIRLAQTLHACVAKGASVLMTNSDTPRIHELYADFDLEPFDEPRGISAPKATARPKASCLLCVSSSR